MNLQYPTNFSRSGVRFDLIAQKIQSDLGDAGISVTLKPGEINTELANYRADIEGPPTEAELDIKLGRGQPCLGLENRFRHSEGDYRWLAWAAVPMPEATWARPRIRSACWSTMTLSVAQVRLLKMGGRLISRQCRGSRSRCVTW